MIQYRYLFVHWQDYVLLKISDIYLLFIDKQTVSVDSKAIIGVSTVQCLSLTCYHVAHAQL